MTNAKFLPELRLHQLKKQASKPTSQIGGNLLAAWIIFSERLEAKVMKKRVLVIDDEFEVREIIQISLEDLAGWQVTTCDSANVVRVWDSGTWDAILVDLDLGIPQVVRLAQQLQRLSIEFDVPVIYLTSRVMPNEVAQYAQFKPAGILAKPFDPQQLGYEVARLAGWSSAKKMNRGSIADVPPTTQLSVIGIGFS